MSCDSLPENSIVVGCGAVGVDFLAAVAAYPKPDDKIRSTSFKVEGGGNTGNALTCAARLGLKPRIISKVADDTQGRGILDELQADGVDTSFMVVSKEGTSPFTYIIVDNQTKSRTCIHTPGFPPTRPVDLPESSLLSALNGARIVYLDGRLHETALVVANEAVKKNIPILVDAERLREGLDDLLKLVDYVVCPAQFPQVWTEAPTVPKALVSMLLRLPKVKFVIVTLGKDGCIMLERSVNEGPSTEEMDIDKLLESLEMRKNGSIYTPTCISSSVTKLRAEGIGTICGRLYVGTPENIPPSELMDTTGAGDAFAGAILYGNRPPLFFIFSFWPLNGHSLSLAIDGALLKHIYGRVLLSSRDMGGLWFPLNTSWRRREQYSQSGAVLSAPTLQERKCYVLLLMWHLPNAEL